MPNILVLCFEGFSFSSRQLYEQLLPKLLSRAVVHESLTVQDALNYLSSSWPSIILVTDAVITEETEETEKLLYAVANYTKHGCTTIFMGLFAGAVNFERLDAVFKNHFDLRWRVAEVTSDETHLLSIDQNMIRTSSLVPSFYAKGLFLSRVPAAQTVYARTAGATMNAYAAYGRVGLGKLGYIADVNFGEEPERLIIAMCTLDREEDALSIGL